MPLSAPPNRTNLYLAIAIAVCVVGSLYTLTRSSLPHVGDNIHSLPHGGRYRDGTKQVDYCSPGRRYPSSNLLAQRSNIWVLALIIALIAGIWCTTPRTHSHTCSGCSRTA
ncbi:triple gene block protein 2 [Elderberry carlavirus D]|uniref:Movement protein TGB2 n=1 Tax=Elderberry carlavirus D TaxID=1569055 RepID=A0A0A7M8U8_9VIRU|nr:triple gene block protein 2 [Elderberry carlavirus D]AIZ76633.1 triple gene block protein 2 [Elderberry carlavirus D]